MRDNRKTLTRRHLLMSAAGVAATAMVPRIARADRYGPVGGTRILIVGDSMIAGGLGLYLARALGEEHGYDVTRRGKSSSGLARPDFFDWMKEARSLVGDRPFDASLVMFGGNDVQGLNLGGDEWIRWQDEGWADEYAARVAAFAEILAPDDQQLFWVGMPVMRPAQFNGRMDRVNTIFRAEMAIRHRSKFIDIWSLLANDKGEYTDRIFTAPEGEGRRKKVQVRASDGIHMTVAGAHYVAAHVGAVVHEILSR